MRFVFTALLALLFVLPSAHAQDAPSVTTSDPDELRFVWGASLQARTSYNRAVPAVGEATERLGVGLRRARVSLAVQTGGRFGFNAQFDFAGPTYAPLDVWASYRPAPRWRLRLGRMVSAQPRAHILTSMTRIDAIGRAAIAERWAGAAIGGDGRDFGVDVQYRGENTRVLVFLHNGDGSWSRARGNISEEISSGNVSRGIEGTGLALSGYAAYTPPSVPGLEVGGFAGVNTDANPNTEAPNGTGRSYTTASGHVYWGADPGSQPLRLKLDALALRYEATDGLDAQTLRGASLLGAVRLHPAAEAFARAEAFEPAGTDAEADTYLTVGATVSPAVLRGLAFHRERLTLAYNGVSYGATDARDHQLVLQLQLVF